MKTTFGGTEILTRVTRRISPTIRRVPVRQDSNPPGAESRRMLNPPGRASIRRVPARRVSDPPGAAEAQDTMVQLKLFAYCFKQI